MAAAVMRAFGPVPTLILDQNVALLIQGATNSMFNFPRPKITRIDSFYCVLNVVKLKIRAILSNPAGSQGFDG